MLLDALRVNREGIFECFPDVGECLPVLRPDFEVSLKNTLSRLPNEGEELSLVGTVPEEVISQLPDRGIVGC